MTSTMKPRSTRLPRVRRARCWLPFLLVCYVLCTVLYDVYVYEVYDLVLHGDEVAGLL